MNIYCWEFQTQILASPCPKKTYPFSPYVAWLSFFSQSPPTRIIVSVVISLTILVTMSLVVAMLHSGSNAMTPFVTSSDILYCKITGVRQRTIDVVITTTGQVTFSTLISGLVSLHTLMWVEEVLSNHNTFPRQQTIQVLQGKLVRSKRMRNMRSMYSLQVVFFSHYLWSLSVFGPSLVWRF